MDIMASAWEQILCFLKHDSVCRRGHEDISGAHDEPDGQLLLWPHIAGGRMLPQ